MTRSRRAGLSRRPGSSRIRSPCTTGSDSPSARGTTSGARPCGQPGRCRPGPAAFDAGRGRPHGQGRRGRASSGLGRCSRRASAPRSATPRSSISTETCDSRRASCCWAARGLEPERMTSWEVGVRQDAGTALSRWMPPTTRIACATSSSEPWTSSAIRRAPRPRHFNAGRARMRGVELALTFRPTAWLVARPTMRSRMPGSSRTTPGALTVDKQVTFVPKARLERTVTAILRRLVITGTARGQSAVFATDTNTDTVHGVPGAYDGFAEVDVAATYTITRRVQATASVENVFDRRYYLFYRNAGRLVFGGVRVTLR
ncbi:MAG: TonB-dependent receptor [Vicinamibacterales bacterium]